MKKITTLIIMLLFTANSFSQHQKGDLLLEGILSGSWTSLGLLDNTVFGTYITDDMAITAGLIAVMDDEISLSTTLGVRYHFSGDFNKAILGKNPLVYATLINYRVGVDSDLAWEAGVRNRFYANKWLAFEPGMGVAKLPDIPVTFRSYVGISCIF